MELLRENNASADFNLCSAQQHSGKIEWSGRFRHNFQKQDIQVDIQSISHARQRLGAACGYTNRTNTTYSYIYVS